MEGCTSMKIVCGGSVMMRHGISIIFIIQTSRIDSIPTTGIWLLWLTQHMKCFFVLIQLSQYEFLFCSSQPNSSQHKVRGLCCSVLSQHIPFSPHTATMTTMRLVESFSPASQWR